MNINSISDFRRAMRHGKYAWPGGYPCYFVMSDGEALSFDAARMNIREILESFARGYGGNGWRPVAFEINYEDANLYCAHSNERIESAYAEDEWSGSPAPDDPDNVWIDDKTGERKPA